jgi:hypothetical protein
MIFGLGKSNITCTMRSGCAPLSASPHNVGYVKFAQHCLRGLSAPTFRYFRVPRSLAATSRLFVLATFSVRPRCALPLHSPRLLRPLGSRQCPLHVGDGFLQFRFSLTAPPRSETSVLLRLIRLCKVRLGCEGSVSNHRVRLTSYLFVCRCGATSARY